MYSSRTYFNNNIRLLFCFFLILLFSISYAQKLYAEISIENLEYLLNDVIAKNLDKNPEWLSLLHYRENTFTKTYYSEIDGSHFFNANNGRRNPRAELFATIKAMHINYISEVNRHPQCLFPARLSWLKLNLPDFNKNLPRIKCNKFLEWHHFMNAESISLVFIPPSNHSSGSIFGNSFLKINPPKLRRNVFNKDKNLLPAKAISYAIKATQQQQNEWFYSFKAASGHYPGQYTVESYVSRIARYKNSENRDIWEYELNLTPMETERLLEHVWELLQTKIDYYYLDENSAYALLSLIDAIKPELKLTESFSLQVLPVDTVRVLIEKEVVSNINYIPSTLTNIKFHLDEYPSSQQELIIGLIDGSRTTSDPEFQKLVSTAQVFIIEIAKQYLQLSFKRGDIDRISYKIRSLRLRKARKKLDPLIELANAPPPRVRPDQGFKTSKLVFGVGQSDNIKFIELNWRPALHDLLDNDGAYTIGTQMNYLDTVIRFEEQKGIAQIERLHFIHLYSLLPRSPLFKPWSFKFKVGLDRAIIFSQSKNLYFNMSGGVGVSYNLSKQILVYGLIEITSIIDKRFKNKISFAAGPNVGFLWRASKNWKIWLDSSTQYYDQQNTYNIVDNLSLAQSYTLSKNKVLRLSLTRQGIQSHRDQEAKLSITWYY